MKEQKTFKKKCDFFLMIYERAVKKYYVPFYQVKEKKKKSILI